jgi:hypothetical protein
MALPLYTCRVFQVMQRLLLPSRTAVGKKKPETWELYPLRGAVSSVSTWLSMSERIFKTVGRHPEQVLFNGSSHDENHSTVAECLTDR